MLPWRSDEGVTECGLNAGSVKTLAREEFFARLKDFGQQRTAMVTCMTCSDTAKRWGTWADDPRKALEREIQWETAWRRDDRGMRLRDELLAVAALIEAHSEEFHGHMAATDQRRQWLEKKAANAAAKAKAAPPPRPLGLL